jgi:hypothetical protein
MCVEGRTVGEATEDLAGELRLWVERHDEEHEGYPFTPRNDEPELVDLVRRLLAVDSLLDALRTALPEATPRGRGGSPGGGRREG